MRTTSDLRSIGFFAGVLAGAAWMSLPFFPPACAPITESSEDLCNRLWTPALAGMLAGFATLYAGFRRSLTRFATAGLAGVVIGLALMVLGNGAEYWLLNDLPHQGPDGRMRSVAWMTLLLGFLLVLVGALVAGGAILGAADGPRLVGVLFALVLPVTIAFGLVSQSAVGIPLGALSVVAAGYGLLVHRRTRTVLKGKRETGELASKPLASRRAGPTGPRVR